MQLPIIGHRGQIKPYGSVPRINWGHPLTWGLISYGYDVGCGPIDLVIGSQRIITNSTSPPFGGVKSSKYGTGLNSISTATVTTGLYNLPGNANIENLVVAAPYSFACGLMITLTPVATGRLFCTCDATSNNPVIIGCFNAVNTDYWVRYLGGTNNATASGVLKINTFQTLLGVALTGT